MNIDTEGALSATLSKPVNSNVVQAALGRPYVKIKIKVNTASAADSNRAYFVEKFTAAQSFHEHMGCEAFGAFLNECVGKVFLNCVVRTADSEVSYYTMKDGHISRHQKATATSPASFRNDGECLPYKNAPFKHHILPEGTPVPFLVRLGVMTDTGKVVQSKYDKFKQINRFLEYIRDVVNGMGIEATGSDAAATDIEQGTADSGTAWVWGGASASIRVVDFGCGKAYLTFAIHYYLTKVLHLKAFITGLDLKADVVEYCNNVATELHCQGLHFRVGNIADYNGETPDLVVALHACDTATDEALAFAVRSGARAILSAPCCQHEVNRQLCESGITAKLTAPTDAGTASPFAPLLRYGLLRERFAALATDALRAEYLEAAGYSVQLLEFIDAEHTPKNILIRAVKRSDITIHTASAEASAFSDALGVNITLAKLLFI